MKRRRIFAAVFLLGLLVSGLAGPVAGMERSGPLQTVAAVPVRPEWDRFKILVWQFRTSILQDIDLYRQVGLEGFHIDRGYGKEDLVRFSLAENLPYYVDHAADKGILYLTKDNAAAVTGKRDLVVRPHSLADPETIRKLKEHLARNIPATKGGLVLAYAFDDEISLGSFTSPCDVDIHPASLSWFREWLKGVYKDVERLNAQWGTRFQSFEQVMPQGFEEIRKRVSGDRLLDWNLSPWMDFRHFMDFQFASVLSDLTRYANTLDPKTPAGFVGGQAPSPWGGYDYAMLSRTVQWMEAYDIHGTNEILRSFWNEERRPRVQTFFSTKNKKLDSWFLWYYLLHGNQAAIAWPEGWFRTGEHDIAPHVSALKDTFEAIQGPVSEIIVDPETKFDADPIGIYYSHPSIQAGWAMDALVHGRTWTNRKSSVDNDNQSAGVLRNVWCKTLEDLGFQYDFVSYLDVREGGADLSKFKVVLLPKTVCLSDREAEALRSFVEQGGTLVADHLCGLFDGHGKARKAGVLDDLFGVRRNDGAGYMNGKGLAEIDGEKYRRHFAERFTHHDGALRYKGLVVFERGTMTGSGATGSSVEGTQGHSSGAPAAIIEKRAGKGRTVYLNLSPLEYWDPARRFGEYGDTWRGIVSHLLKEAGLEPKVRVQEKGGTPNMIEALFWKKEEKFYLGLVKNPTIEKERAQAGDFQGITGSETEIRLEFPVEVELVNMRTGKSLGRGKVFMDGFKPWEGNLYQVIYLDGRI